MGDGKGPPEQVNSGREGTGIQKSHDSPQALTRLRIVFLCARVSCSIPGPAQRDRARQTPQTKLEAKDCHKDGGKKGLVSLQERWQVAWSSEDSSIWWISEVQCRICLKDFQSDRQNAVQKDSSSSSPSAALHQYAQGRVVTAESCQAF